MSSYTKLAVDHDFLWQLVNYGKPFDSISEKNEFYRNFFARHDDLTRLERQRISRIFTKIRLGQRLVFAEKSTELLDLLSQATEIHGEPETTSTKSNTEMLTLKKQIKMEQNRLLRSVSSQMEYLATIEKIIKHVDTFLNQM